MKRGKRVLNKFPFTSTPWWLKLKLGFQSLGISTSNLKRIEPKPNGKCTELRKNFASLL